MNQENLNKVTINLFTCLAGFESGSDKRQRAVSKYILDYLAICPGPCYGTMGLESTLYYFILLGVTV